ncbi:MAG: hypothetical protein QM747_18920 [Nocardioides sp.]
MLDAESSCFSSHPGVNVVAAAAAVSVGSRPTSSPPVLPFSCESCGELPSPTAASSRPSPVKRRVAAPPLKLDSAFENGSSPSAVLWNAVLWSGPGRRTRLGERLGRLSEQVSAHQAEELLARDPAGVGRGVGVDHSCLAHRLGPLLVRRVVGEARRGRRAGDLAGHLLRLGERRPPVLDHDPGVVVGAGALADLVDALAGRVVVLDLHDEHEVRLVVAQRHDGGRHPVPEPRVDIAGEVEARAAGVADELVTDLLPQVVDAVDADLLLVGRELVQGPEGVDLLPAGGVEVEAEVADGVRGQRLRGLGALLEEAHRGPGARSGAQDQDHSCGEPEHATSTTRRCLLVESGRSRRNRCAGGVLEVLGRARRRRLVLGHGRSPP